MWSYNCFDVGLKGIIKKMAKRIIKIYVSLTHKTLESLTKEYIDVVDTAIETEKAYAFSDVGHLIAKKGVESPVYRKFENIQMLVPSDYDMVLKGLYGSDYMQLPPKEKRWNQAPMYIGFSDGSAVDFQNNG